ncbi:MAG: Hsp33 family molecular chaperone HslO [Desulfobacteraceae bacterium]
MKDHLVRIVTKTGNLRGIACSATSLVKEACRRHRTSPTASVALGRALAGGALMGALVKGDQRVALKFEGSGPIRKILVEAQADGAVCGYVGNPEADLPPSENRFDVPGLLGRAGLLTVTKDLRLKEPYSGTVELLTSEIGEDLAYYMTESEQIPSAVGLGVLLGKDLEVATAGGFLVQALPPTEEAEIEGVTSRIAGLSSIAEMAGRENGPEEILEHLFRDLPFEVLEERPVFFQCRCSVQRMKEALVALGPKEIASLSQERQAIEVRCEFCGETYQFSTEDLKSLGEPWH